MYQYKAKCVKVIDGDSMEFNVDLGFHLTNRIRVRLKDIDTPEIFGKDNDKILGKKVKQFVCEQLFNFLDQDVEPVEVVIATKKTSSFGWWLATVTFANGSTLSDKIREQFPEIK